jgi:hypothetical protein
VKERLALDALDADEPFELDSDNIPHLAKHAPFTADDVLDAWTFGDPLFYEADGPADWLMIARLAEGIVLVPLAASRSGDPQRCRPIGIYEPSRALMQQYEEDLRA